MKYVTWAAMAVITLVMLMGGTMKLTGQPMALQSFADLGLPGIFATFIGVCEIAGAIGLWLRPTSRLAAMGLGVIMMGAVYYHVAFPPIEAGVPALVVLLSCGLVVYRKGGGIVG